MGGNVGIQSSTIMVRGLATGEVDFSRLFRVLFGEVRVGAIMRALLRRGGGIFRPSTYSDEEYAVRLGLSVGSAMFAGIVASAFLGTAVPLLCARSASTRRFRPGLS